MLRATLFGAQAYNERMRSAGTDGAGGDPLPARDLTKELGRGARGELSLLVTANSATEIAVALPLQREFDLVLDSAAESYLLLEEIRVVNVPVLVHPPMSRVRNGSLETAARLAEAGIPFAIQAGFEGYVPKTRALLWEAAIAAAHRLSPERALEALTLGAAHPRRRRPHRLGRG